MQIQLSRFALSWRLRRKRILIPFGCTVGLFLIGLFFLSRYLEHNSGMVVKGEFYRTAQVDAQELQHEIEIYHLRSVVNLRGANNQTPWYDQEIAMCRKMGVTHADVRLGAKHLPPPADVAELLKLYRILPRPLLIHCESGSDRSGLASAIYLIDQKHLSPATAGKQLSLGFAHLSVYPYFEMNEFIELYRDENPQHRPMDEWVTRDYPAIYEAESKETTWDEIIEPVESFVRFQYRRHR